MKQSFWFGKTIDWTMKIQFKNLFLIDIKTKFLSYRWWSVEPGTHRPTLKNSLCKIKFTKMPSYIKKPIFFTLKDPIGYNFKKTVNVIIKTKKVVDKKIYEKAIKIKKMPLFKNIWYM